MLTPKKYFQPNLIVQKLTIIAMYDKLQYLGRLEPYQQALDCSSMLAVGKQPSLFQQNVMEEEERFRPFAFSAS